MVLPLLLIGAAAASAAPSPLLAPEDLAAVFEGSPPSHSVELRWALLPPPPGVASDFALAQSRYQLRTACGGARPTLTEGAGASSRHHAADPAAIGVAPHSSCAFTVRVGDPIISL
jgi:hypothetical protein